MSRFYVIATSTLVTLFLLFATVVAQGPPAQIADQVEAVEAIPEKPIENQAPPAEPAPAEQPAAEPTAPAGPETTAPAAAVPGAEELSELVNQLGDDEFRVREGAANQLRQLGSAARQQLLAGLESSDPEIRRSCRRILGQVLDADYQQKLTRFMEDVEGKLEHDLPGWKRYQERIGTDKEARNLFVEMHKEEGGLMASSEAGESAATDALRLRFHQVFAQIYSRNRGIRNRTPPSIGTVSAMLFVCADTNLKIPSDLANNNQWPSLIQQQPFIAGVQNGPNKTALRKVLGEWVALPTEMPLLHTKLNFAMQYGIPEGLPLAIRAVGDNNIQAGYKAYAISALGKLGGKPHAARLAELLTDEGLCSQRHVNVNGKQNIIKIEVRDLALAWLVHLTDQSLAEYHLPHAKAAFDQIAKYPHATVSAGNVWFESVEKRNEALAKWKAYVEKNPLPAAPEPVVRKPEEAKQEEAKPPANQGAAVKPQGRLQAAQLQIAVAAPRFIPGVAAVKANAQEEAGPKMPVGIQLADRQFVRQLTIARRMMQDRRYTEASQILGEILISEEQAAYQPDRAIPLFVGLHSEAEQLLSEMPAEGQAAYELQFGADARRLLQAAVEEGDEAKLEAVMRKYFYTQAGGEAAFLLAARHWDRGHALRAAFCLERIEARRIAGKPHPELALQLAASWALAGMPAKAERAFAKVAVSSPPGQLRIGDAPFAAQSAAAWLANLAGERQLAASAWPVFRGDSSRNASAESTIPYLKGNVWTATTTNEKVRASIEQLMQTFENEHRAMAPSLHPLVVGDKLLLRTATQLVALDAANGNLLWNATLEDTLEHWIRNTSDQQKQEQASFLSEGLKSRLYSDATFGTLSSDGRLVYGVEDLAFNIDGDYQRLVVMPDGRRRLDPGAVRTDNILAAYDVETGKLAWEAGGPTGVAGAKLPGTFFLGPPLPLGGRLYVLAKRQQNVLLLELSAASGDLLWELALADVDAMPDMPMPNNLPLSILQGSREKSGASPSCASGVLVCPTSDNAYAAVDLTTRKVQWVYEADEESSLRLGPQFGNIWQRKLMQQSMEEESDDWADASATIVENRVLLTPAGSGKLFCLNLVDGRVQWSTPRRDGFYVGGVIDGMVLVVGRGNLWGVNLEDGKPAWPHERLPLPPGAMPSGRGYFSQGLYYLPLTTAEVAVVDAAGGEIIARSRSHSGQTPGNLVASEHGIFSQSPLGVLHFSHLKQRREELELALEQTPDNALLLADLGEALLCEGKVAEAVSHLYRALQIEANPRTHQLLSEALAEGLTLDFDAFAELAARIDPQQQSPEKRAEFLQKLAHARQKAGRVEESLAAYLDLTELNFKPDELVHVAAARAVRRDRWIDARVYELRLQAADKAKFDAAILAKFSPEKVLSNFPSLPAADSARLQLAEKQIAEKQWLSAQNLLLEVRQAGTENQQAAAAALMAELFQAAGRIDDAASAYAHLNEVYATTVCREGKTGRQLFEELAEDGPVRKWLAAPRVWPNGKVNKQVANKRQGMQYQYPISARHLAGDSPLQLEIDTSGRVLTAYDRFGRQRWACQLGQGNPNFRYSGAVYSHSQGDIHGELVVVWIGSRVCAVDGFSGKLLWSHDTITTKPLYPGMRMFLPMQMQMPRQVSHLSAAEISRVALAGSAVCFLQDRRLLAVDATTGKPLWQRDAMAADSDIFGDADILLVTSPDAEEAMVLSTRDGRELGRRPVAELDSRLALRGRHILTYASDAEGAKVELIDPWEQKTVWSRAFPAGTKPWMIETGDEFALLDRQGNFRVLSTASGEDVLSLQTPPEEELDNIIVRRSAEHYLLIASTQGDQGNIFFQQMGMGAVPANGMVYGIDRKSAAIAWKQPVVEQMFKANQGSDLPLLVFLNMIQKFENRSYQTSYKLACLDSRTGEVLHEESASGSNNMVQIVSDPEKNTIEVKTTRPNITFTFTGE